MRTAIKSMWNTFTHAIGRMNKKYYFEDYVRVYPGGLAFNRLGRLKAFKKEDFNNYLNHCKFYCFAAQFVEGKMVSDIGCGSGYGSKILMESGAMFFSGFDISKVSISYANLHFSKYGTFGISSITDLHTVADKSYDVTICSEVLEHIKEYKMEAFAVDELKRITQTGGLIIVGTPNTELLDNHGFSYDEINEFFAQKFTHYCIFENAFIPNGAKRGAWDNRLATNRTGVIVSESINLDESCLPHGAIPELKHGLVPGFYHFYHYQIDTRLLHNTHSWVILAVN